MLKNVRSWGLKLSGEAMTDLSQNPAHWRLERSITLGVILALTLQTASALLWAGAVSERLDQLENRAAQSAPMTERLARLEEHAAYSRAALERIERRMDEG